MGTLVGLSFLFLLRVNPPSSKEISDPPLGLELEEAEVKEDKNILACLPLFGDLASVLCRSGRCLRLSLLGAPLWVHQRPWGPLPLFLSSLGVSHSHF